MDRKVHRLIKQIHFSVNYKKNVCLQGYKNNLEALHRSLINFPMTIQINSNDVFVWNCCVVLPMGMCNELNLVFVVIDNPVCNVVRRDFSRVQLCGFISQALLETNRYFVKHIDVSRLQPPSDETIKPELR